MINHFEKAGLYKIFPEIKITFFPHAYWSSSEVSDPFSPQLDDIKLGHQASRSALQEGAVLEGVARAERDSL